jgi:sugar phosphate isomerase/epimerase
MSANKPLPISVQLYSLRSLPETFDELLGQVAAIGYPGVETVGTHGLSSDEMSTLLDKHNLKVTSGHYAIPMLQYELGDVIAFNKAIDNDVIIVPALPDKMRSKNAANWIKVGKLLDSIGAQCAAEGIRLQYHNHWWEMDVFDGKLAIDWLLENASPENLGFEPDLAWIVRGGADPLDLLARYSGRYPRVHAKDLAKPGESNNDMGLADVGSGTLDWDALLPAALAGGAEWFVVEHDVPPVPLASIQSSFEFLKSKLG